MNFTQKIQQMAQAITIYEGYFPPSWLRPWGSASYKNHNPGNLRYSEYTISLGAIGCSPMSFAIFPDFQTGHNALCQLLTDACSGKLPEYAMPLTILGFFNIYAPTGDNNKPNLYAAFVAAHMNTPLDTQISTFVS